MVLFRFHFINFVECPVVGLKGGIVLAWSNGCDVEVIGCEENLISVVVYSDPLSPMVIHRCLHSH